MGSRKDFFNGCFPADWVEVDLSGAKKETVTPEEKKTSMGERKNVAVLLAELEDIKNAFEKIEEKKIRLQNLMSFYKGELLAE